jgi:hypothetical protein
MNNNINFKELRLDNYICINNNLHPCRVKEITMSSVVVESIKENYSEPTINSMNPIPLTEEWLLKFGFYKSDNYGNDEYRLDGYSYFRGRFYISDCDECGEDVEINFVHELQNLYFALTKKELTMK